MKQLYFKLFVLLAIGFVPSAIFAQGGSSLQKITVTSVTLRLDSVDTPAEALRAKDLIQAHKEVQDFDIKMQKCNFTMDNSSSTLDQILNELKAAGMSPQIYAVRLNQSFTRVPEERCDGGRNVPDMSEDEVRKRGIEKGNK